MKYFYLLAILSALTACSKDVALEGIQHNTSIVTEKEELLSNGDTLVTFINGVQVVKKRGEYILNGDIILTSEEINHLRNPFTRGAYFLDHCLWYDQTVYYSISPDFYEKDALRQAITYISNRTNIRFCERTIEPDYILFCNSSKNSSYVGRKGGEQVVNLYNQYLGVIVHEVCHALGMIHEHSRIDRDQYVTIHYDNIKDNMLYNFNIEYGTYNNSDFDFSSVMIYPSIVSDPNFAIDVNKPVMTQKDGSIFRAQRDGLSTGDIQALNRMYHIDKYQIVGEQYVAQQGTAEYMLTNSFGIKNINWEINPSNGAVIVAGQGTNKIKVLFNEIGYHTVNATITFTDSYPYYIRKAQNLSVYVSNLPMVSDIDLFKYFQGDGEYTLKATVVNGQDATVQWHCDGQAVIHDLPYPDDAIFLDEPQLFTAIDFYSVGTYNISCFATNAIGSGIYFTKSFNINDAKNTFFPLSLSPNPIPLGIEPVLEVNESGIIEKSDVHSNKKMEIVIYSDGKEVYKKTTFEKKVKLTLQKLKKGKYNIMVSTDGKSYVTTFDIV